MNVVTIGNDEYMITGKVEAKELNQQGIIVLYILSGLTDTLDYVLSLFDDNTYRLYSSHKDIQRGHILKDIQFDQSITSH